MATVSSPPAAGPDLPDEALTAPPVRRLAAEYLEHAGELGHGLALELHERIPELGAGDEDLLRATRASCESNVVAVFTLLARRPAREEIRAPREAIEYAHQLVRRGIPLAAILRAYRLGHAWLWDRWSHAMEECGEDAAEVVRLLDACSTFMFDYVDRVCDRLVEEYGAERERWVRSAAAVRAEAARALVAGEPVDLDAAGRRLGYELRRHHLALVLCARPGADAVPAGHLERAAADAAAAAGCREPLLIPAGMGVLWAWCGTREALGEEALAGLERHRPDPGVLVAVGRSRAGADGFARSHVEALEAARLARLAADPAPVTTYRTVRLAALLSRDVDAARAFVAEELGELAAPAEPVRRLRLTLRTFLECAGSHVAASRRLHVHQNTVAYRVRRAEEILGRPVATRRLELETALLLADVLADDGEDEPA